MSETVARTGWPGLPKTSQNTTGQALECEVVELERVRCAPCIFGDWLARLATARTRSPLTSAMNTGTPIAEKRFGQHLQRDGLAGAGGAGDQAVAVGQLPAAEQFVFRLWR